jgi:gluconolactonase
MQVLAELPSEGAVEFMGPDGVTMDTDGNLYIAHFGTGLIRVLSPNGALLKSLPGGSQYVSNLVIRSDQVRELYITGSGDTWHPGVVYRLQLEDITEP